MRFESEGHGTRTEKFKEAIRKLLGDKGAKEKATSFAEAMARQDGPKSAAERLLNVMARRVHSYRNPAGFPCQALPGTLEFKPDGPNAKAMGQATFP